MTDGSRMNIGTYALTWVGDVVMTLPLMDRCRELYPETSITAIT